MLAERNDTVTEGHPQAHTLIVGLGKTGMSCVRYLQALGEPVSVVDTRDIPPGLASLREEFSQTEVVTGEFGLQALDGVNRIIVSPGFDPSHPVLREADKRGIEILGDIELFARVVDKPVVAITGTNGKSTVTAMVGAIADAAGYRVAVGGNFGIPALDLLDKGADFYVLELSSFQLEHVWSLAPIASVVLNLEADHLDRYANLEAYAAAKAVIYENAENQVVNRDDPGAARLVDREREIISFGLSEPDGSDFGVSHRPGGNWLVRGHKDLMPVAELYLQGAFVISDALAAMALAHAAALPEAAVRSGLAGFRGLPHRMQLVARHADIEWYDDSKGTNPAATVAALGALDGPIILIAGGDGKGASFEPLREAIGDKVRVAILMGKDRERLAAAVSDIVEIRFVDDMQAAVSEAARFATAGDKVLLSPACASLDMFRDYAERGEQFCAAVEDLQ